MKKRRISLIILLLLLSAVCLVSLTMAWKEYADRASDSHAFEQLAELVEQPKETDEPATETTDDTTNTTDTTDTQTELEPTEQKRNLAPIMEQNSECIGWICIEGTVVDYPVMHTPNDPQKYLRKNFEGVYSVSGVPFLDYRCILDSTNLILYGHNMKNGTMFSAVTGYAKESYWKEHPTIELETADGCKTYAVFAAVSVKKTDGWYAFITAESEEAFQDAVSAIRAKARYSTGIVPEYGKQLLTLSTCYGSSKDDRLIVIAVEI